MYGDTFSLGYRSYKRCFLLKEEAFHKIWIAPEIDKKAAVSARRLAKYLLSEKGLKKKKGFCLF